MKPCLHIHITKVANLGKGTYRCDNCKHYLKAEEWDGKVKVLEPTDPRGPEITD